MLLRKPDEKTLPLKTEKKITYHKLKYDNKDNKPVPPGLVYVTERVGNVWTSYLKKTNERILTYGMWEKKYNPPEKEKNYPDTTEIKQFQHKSGEWVKSGIPYRSEKNRYYICQENNNEEQVWKPKALEVKKRREREKALIQSATDAPNQKNNKRKQEMMRANSPAKNLD